LADLTKLSDLEINHVRLQNRKAAHGEFMDVLCLRTELILPAPKVSLGVNLTIKPDFGNGTSSQAGRSVAGVQKESRWTLVDLIL
jgi:hypothetical protein